jgi:hypothetical protein
LRDERPEQLDLGDDMGAIILEGGGQGVLQGPKRSFGLAGLKASPLSLFIEPGTRPKCVSV